MTATRQRNGKFLALAGALFALTACSTFKVPHVTMPPMGSGAPTIGPMGATTLRSAPIKGAAARFAVVRISGPPPDIMLTMAKDLSSEAQLRRLNMVTRDDPSATYLVRGYLSAVGDRQGTSLIYVWDVVDRKGVRLHRISGQEPGAGTASDPWAGITNGAVGEAARNTIDDLVAWAGAG
jgi:hypothetical protein